MLDSAFDELWRDADATVALAAGLIVVDTTFRYIDRISEHVVTAYESERVRWLANRSLPLRQVRASCGMPAAA